MSINSLLAGSIPDIKLYYKNIGIYDVNKSDSCVQVAITVAKFM